MTSNVLKVYLLRHGQTDMNADRNRYCGRTDAQLTELGRSQAKGAGDMLRSIDFAAVFASPLQRSGKTAELLDLSLPVQVDERLIELDFGGWEGMTQNPTRSTVHPLAQEEINPEAQLFFRIVVTGTQRLPQNQSNATYHQHLSPVNAPILSIVHRYARSNGSDLHSCPSVRAAINNL